MKISIVSFIKDGIISETHSRIINDSLRGFTGYATIKIEKAKRKRSLNQNAYYWGVVLPAVVDIFLEYGDSITPEEAHEFCKQEIGCLQRVMINPSSGMLVKINCESKKLNTAEFEDYLEKCRAWCASNGVVVSLPNEGRYAPPE